MAAVPCNFLIIIVIDSICVSNLNAQKNNYIFEMDYLRGLAILLVISVYVSSVFTGMNATSFLYFLYISIDTFSEAAVPLFIFISGFVLFLNYQRNFSLVTFYKKRFLSVVPQYLIFSTFYLVFFMCLTYLNLQYQTGPVTFSLKDIFYDYLTGNASFQLWFFTLIIQLYIVYPLLAYFCRTIFLSKTQTGVFLCILFLIPFFQHNGFFDFFWNSGLIFLEFLFYFILGMYVSSKYYDIKDFIHKLSLKTFLIPLLFFNILGVFFSIGKEDPEYIQSIGSPSFITLGTRIFSFFEPVFYGIIFLLLFVLVLNLDETEFFSKCLRRLGDLSFGIFLIDVMYITLIPVIAEEFNFTFNNYLYYPIVFLSTLILSVVSILVIRKLPFSEYIVGKIRD